MNQYFQVSSLSISLSVEGPCEKSSTDGHIPRPRLHKFSLIPFLQQSMEIEEIRSLWLCQAVPSCAIGSTKSPFTVELPSENGRQSKHRTRLEAMS